MKLFVNLTCLGVKLRPMSAYWTVDCKDCKMPIRISGEFYHNPEGPTPPAPIPGEEYCFTCDQTNRYSLEDLRIGHFDY